MDKKDFDKRQFVRVYFPMEMIVEGVVTLPGTQQDSITRVLNLSQNGLCFVLDNNNARNVKVSDSVRLKELTGLEPFALSREIDVEVKWFLDHESFDHVMFGGEFTDLTVQDIESIDTLIEAFSDK